VDNGCVRPSSNVAQQLSASIIQQLANFEQAGHGSAVNFAWQRVCAGSIPGFSGSRPDELACGEGQASIQGSNSCTLRQWLWAALWNFLCKVLARVRGKRRSSCDSRPCVASSKLDRDVAAAHGGGAGVSSLTR